MACRFHFLLLVFQNDSARLPFLQKFTAITRRLYIKSTLLLYIVRVFRMFRLVT